MLAPPWIPVPPPEYGGIESVVALVSEALVRAGTMSRCSRNASSCAKWPAFGLTDARALTASTPGG
jgi:hypothetical protein